MTDARGAMAEFLFKGGEITKLKPRAAELREKKPLCEKCRINPAVHRFSDVDGNKYHWCEICYDE